VAGAEEEELRDERMLVESLRAQDPEASERMVRLHIGMMRAVALRLLRDLDEADEAVQEAFINAFRALPSFRGESRLSTWLHRITVNAALARLRSQQTRKVRDTVDLESALPEYEDGAVVGGAPLGWPEPADVLAQRSETRAQVRRMIDRLPDTHRTVLVLRDIEELSTRETAGLLGVSEGVVKTRLHRARMALRTLFVTELGSPAAGAGGGDATP
jgi:RNA polymerase sigma-70 factor (ECF subfamily)